MTKRLASISLDLDNIWSYMKTHGDDGWESFPSYLDIVVPRFLEFFEKRKTKITVFVVGQDAAIGSNHPALRSIAEAGHEIGNHSFNHEPWLHLYTQDQLIEEFEKSEAAILSATGAKPLGFRGPGFSFSDDVLNVLASRGYQYDASTFPTFLGPVARAYYFFNSKLSSEEKEDRQQLFGSFSEGFGPNKPFKWQIGRMQLLEIPVTTMPLFKIPIHISYISYLASYSPWLARTYFGMAMQLCRLTGTQPSLLLHPLDFMDINDAPELQFFPAMKLAADKKMQLLENCLRMMEKHYQLVPMKEHARSCLAGKLKSKTVVQTEPPLEDAKEIRVSVPSPVNEGTS
jgi:hypothetical protein